MILKHVPSPKQRNKNHSVNNMLPRKTWNKINARELKTVKNRTNYTNMHGRVLRLYNVIYFIEERKRMLRVYWVQRS